MKFTLTAILALLTLGSVQSQGVKYPADNRAISYIASVGVGSTPAYYDLIIDTGSSNTWIGAKKPYVITSTSRKTGDSVGENIIRVEYGSGGFSGTEYIDQVTLSPDLVLTEQSIGVATSTTGFADFDGILGLGPESLTKGTLSPDTDSIVPTVVENLYAKGHIKAKEFSISFEPITSANGTQMNGQISFGGTDPTKFTGAITYTPITSTPPASHYWGINASATYGPGTGLGTPIFSSIAGIVDSGTTLLLLATEAFDAFQKATGAAHDEDTGLLSVTQKQYTDMKSLFFNINGQSFEMTPNALIWPRIFNGHIGGKADGIYLIVQDLKSKLGGGLDFILGQVFMERIYTVHDIANSRMGFAPTAFTNATTN